MTTAPAQPTSRDVLTQAEAEARAARVSQVSYELSLGLTPKTGKLAGARGWEFVDRNP